MIYTNKDKSSFIVNCSCGCDDGVEIKMDIEDDDEASYAWLQILASKWYTDQDNWRTRTAKKAKKIWMIICGKDYHHNEILMSKSDWKEFVEMVNALDKK